MRAASVRAGSAGHRRARDGGARGQEAGREPVEEGRAGAGRASSRAAAGGRALLPGAGPRAERKESVKVFVSVDMEGASGVASHHDVEPGARHYEQARRWMTADANAAVLGAFDAGATEVLVNDSHDGMLNLILEELDPRAEVIRGSLKPLAMMEGIQEGWDAALFIGYHAMGGTAAAVLDHTMSGRRFHHVLLDGRRATEAELNAALAGEFGVPVPVVSGDDKLAHQVKAFLDPVETVVVKRGLDREVARVLPPAVAAERIREAVRRALGELGRYRPYRPAPFRTAPDGRPLHRLEVEFQQTDMATVASWMPLAERTGDRSVAWEAPDFATLTRILSLLLEIG